MKILIVAPNVSLTMGGEAIIPYHYARELHRLGHEITVLTHARVRDELMATPLANDIRIDFVDDTKSEKVIYKTSKLAPPAIAETAFGAAIGIFTMRNLARHAKELHHELAFDIIHQPTPVSPKMPSFLSVATVPVVIGPMNGAMNYPPAFEKKYARGANVATSLARSLSGLANSIGTAKHNADVLLVANERSRTGLPKGTDTADRVKILVENGVDLDLWPKTASEKFTEPTFVYVGRHVWWKAIDLLIDAFAQLDCGATLKIYGDGPERAALEKQAAELSTKNKKIEFLGFKPQSEIANTLAKSTALVLPSLRECGGAVVLEAFACRTPAIATDWGGPSDYITPETGVLIPPTSKADFITSLTKTMADFVENPAQIVEMGIAARQLIEDNYSWRAKAAQMVGVYEAAIQRGK